MKDVSLLLAGSLVLVFFFFNDTATTEIYTLSLHDALPIFRPEMPSKRNAKYEESKIWFEKFLPRSEEHTSELQSPDHLVCRLLLEKKKVLAIEPGIYWPGGGGLRLEDNFWITDAWNQKRFS